MPTKCPVRTFVLVNWQSNRIGYDCKLELYWLPSAPSPFKFQILGQINAGKRQAIAIYGSGFPKPGPRHDQMETAEGGP